MSVEQGNIMPGVNRTTRKTAKALETAWRTIAGVYLCAGLSGWAICCYAPAPTQASDASPPERQQEYEWMQEKIPYWVLPPAERPANMIEQRIQVPGSISADRFHAPEVCAACHSYGEEETNIFTQWNGSMHSLSWEDPIFQAVAQLEHLYATTEEERHEAEACLRCHTPVGHLSDDPGRHFTGDIAEIAARGVFCDVCHSVASSTGIGNASYFIEPGDAAAGEPGTKYGPFEDAVSPFHKTAYSELSTRPEFCAQCHEVSHMGADMPVERTYSEWREGPYNTGDPETSLTCSGCHMYQRPGVPGTAGTERPANPGYAAIPALGAKERPHIFTHYFVGGNAVVPELLGHPDKAKLARERLQNAASIALNVPEAAITDDTLTFAVRVENVGCGHYLPTGLTYVRQMWLNVKVTDDAGARLFESGQLGANGEIAPGAVIYNTVLGDAEGKPTNVLVKAVRVLSDYRIPPKGFKEETYTVALPRSAQGSAHIQVRLLYRSAPQELVNLVYKEVYGKDREAPTLPVVEMTSARCSVHLAASEEW